MGKRKLQAFADRGYFSGTELKACEDTGITTFVPKPMTSGAKAEGRFDKSDFVYIAERDADHDREETRSHCLTVNGLYIKYDTVANADRLSFVVVVVGATSAEFPANAEEDSGEQRELLYLATAGNFRGSFADCSMYHRSSSRSPQ